MTDQSIVPSEKVSGGSSSRVVFVRPALEHYRISFLERISAQLGDRFVVYASPRTGSGVTDPEHVHPWQRRLKPIRRLAFGLQWQPGVLSIPVRRGDVVVIPGVPRCLSNLALVLKCRLVGATAVWWGQYWSATSESWRAALRIELAKRCYALLFYTEAERETFLASRAGRGRRLVFALNNGLETSEIERLREPFSPHARDRRLLFIGRLTPKSRLDLLVRALADPACRDVRLEVIGSGEKEAEYRALSESLKIRDRITWRGAVVDESRIAKVANQCALFVYPGAVGLSLIHALSYGLPALVHDDRWRHYPEIAALRPGENGFVFRKDDPAALAQAIDKALKDPDMLSRMSAEAARTTSRSFNARDMADRFAAALATIERARAGENRRAERRASS